MKGATGGLDLSFAAAAVAGTNTVNVTLDGTTSGALNVGTGVENVVLTTKNSAATLTDFTTAAATTVTIKGGQGFKLDAAKNFVSATTIDAREAGKAEFTTAAATTLLTGSADDKITFITKTLAVGDLINLGAGNDTLVLNAAANAAATLIGVENVTLKATNSAIDMKNADQKAALTFEGGTTISATGLASGSTVTSTKAAATTVAVSFRDSVMGEKSTIDLQEGASGAVTLTNIKDATINYGKVSGAATIALDNNANGTEVTTDLTVNAKGALTALTLNTATELKNLTVNAEAAVAAVGGTFTKLETLTINTTKSGSFTLSSSAIAASNAAGVNTVKLDATAGAIDIKTAFGLTNTAGSIKDVSIVGNKDVKAALTSSTSNVDKLVSTSTGTTDIAITNNGTANEAGSTVTLGNAATGKTNTLTIDGTSVKNTVTGGTGEDLITTGNGADTIVGGAGNDKITAGGGADTMTGGAGADTFVFVAAGTTGTFGATAATAVTGPAAALAYDVIKDYSGLSGDKDIIDGGTNLLISNASATASATTAATNAKGLVTTWTTGSSTLTLADKITIVEATISGGTAGANEALLFADSGKSYLFISDANAGLTQGDVLIEITGINATLGMDLSGGDITNIA